jgi:hypothetical protein
MTMRLSSMILVGCAAVAPLAIARLAIAQDSFGQAQQLPQQPQQAVPQQQQMPQAPRQPGSGQAPAPEGSGQPPGGVGALQSGPANLDALTQLEGQDYGVAPTAQLHAGQFHGPTPTSIPGGQVITTKGLVELMRSARAPVLVLDVLGGPEMIQGAQHAAPAAQSGAFNDQTQQQFDQYLLDVLQRRAARDQPGLHERPVVSRRHRGVEARRPADAAHAIAQSPASPSADRAGAAANRGSVCL